MTKLRTMKGLMALTGALCLLQANGATLGNPHCLVYAEYEGTYYYELDPKEPNMKSALVWADGEDHAVIPILDDDGGAIVPIVTAGTADESWLGPPQIWMEEDFKNAPDAIFFFENDPSAIRALDICNDFDSCKEYEPKRRWIVVKIKETGDCKVPSTFKIGIQGSDEVRSFYVIPDDWGWDRAIKWIEKNVEVPAAWKKARTLYGTATRAMPNPIAGTFEIKCGKANKKGEAKVSATLTGLDGKKTKYRPKSVNVTDDTVTIDFDGLLVDIAADSFSGSEGKPGGLSVESADVGGNWTRTDSKVYVDAPSLPAGTIEELLPNGEPVLPKSGKWAFNKAASVKLSRDKTHAEWNTSNGKTNLSGLKLAYTPKTGLFKGAFTVYALDGTKLKKYKASVTGVVVDGKGYGQATIKKPAAGPWGVTVK